MRESQYIVIPKNELYHHGILGMRWGIRRFQPYPKGYKGSGKEVGEAKRSISTKVGEKRLKKRLEVTAKGNDKYAAKAGLKNNLLSLDMETLHDQTKDILNDPERVKKIGQKTILKRAGSASLGSLAALGAWAMLGPAIASPLAGFSVGLIPLGMSYLYYRQTKK